PQTTNLRVMTLNIAHGRKDGVNQLFQSADSIRINLDEVARLLRSEQPDVVALQEIDGPSFWSGRFDHVELLAAEGCLPNSFRGEHMSAPRLSYGTALLSRLELGNQLSHRFEPSLPTPRKGFVVASVTPPQFGQTIDVVSVHLDFSRASIRLEQINELITVLAERRRPLIVMGDFNCEWDGPEQTLHLLAEELKLKTFRPKARDLATFSSSAKRLDWIFVSSGLEIEGYRNLPNIVSDHLAVVAEVRISNETR
ncbi:MAG: endonuclease/exonuclease/phosphatase family protein, partial [Phycisphaerae bacterium]